jgi:hypothetical protein
MNAKEIYPKADARLSRIKMVSKIVMSVLFAGLLLEVYSLLESWTVFIGPIINGTIYPIQAYFLGWTSLLMLFVFIVTLKLFKFFVRLKNGHLFDVQTVAYLDAAGKWWLVSWLFDGLCREGRYQIFHITPAWDFGSLFAGLVIIFVAWLLKEAQGLQEEQELTV